MRTRDRLQLNGRGSSPLLQNDEKVAIFMEFRGAVRTRDRLHIGRSRVLTAPLQNDEKKVAIYEY